MQYRTFQADLRSMVESMVNRTMPMDRIYADITPGGGKSSIPPALMPLIKAGLAQKLCWVVPRVTLATQGEEGFVHADLKQLFPHQGRIRRTNGNEIDPSRNCDGYLVTYDAVQEKPTLHQQEFERYRYILILDEAHHIEEGSSYARAIAPLVELAVLRVFMSGTFGRGDYKRVAFLPYTQGSDGKWGLAFPQEQLLRYTRAQAIRQKATCRLDFRGVDGMAEWVDQKGERQKRASFEEETATEGAMLTVALRTQFARQLLQRGVGEWLRYKQYRPQAKLLIVAPWQAVAEHYAKWLQEDFQLDAPLAVSKRPQEALKAIQRYKKEGPERLDILITVGMAYEGLDVKQISHLVCLTRYRTAPWLEQCFSRACRALPWKEAGFIYAPDDMGMREAINLIVSEECLVEDEPVEAPERSGSGGGSESLGVFTADIVPLASQTTTNRAFNYTDDMDTAETAFYDHLARTYGIEGCLSPLQLRDLCNTHNDIPPEQRRLPVEPPQELNVPPSEIEALLRRDVQAHASSVDLHHFHGEHGTTNSMMKRKFRKPRPLMTEAELIESALYLKRHFPPRSKDTLGE